MYKRVTCIFLILISIFCVGCSFSDVNNISENKSTSQIRNFYKTIPVTVTEIKLTWAYKGNLKWNVTYSSEEYGVHNSQEVSNWDVYGDLIRKGQIVTGSQLEATLWSTVQNEEVVGRRLGNLK